MTFLIYFIVAGMHILSGALLMALYHEQRHHNVAFSPHNNSFSSGWKQGFKVAKSYYHRIKDPITGRYLSGGK